MMRKLLLPFFVFVFWLGKLAAQPVANFGSNHQTGCGAVQIIFFDSSFVADAKIVSWKWDLGGVTSDKQNPGKIYDKPGKYTICLEVTDDKGRSNKICKQDYIVIYEKPKADFTIDKTSGCVPFVVNFTSLANSNNGAIIRWTWDIGGNANVINATNISTPISTTYNTQGAKSATLTVMDDKGCEASVSKKDIIIVNAVPEVVLSKDYLSTCDLPWSVNLKNENADPAAQYKWNLGNGVIYSGLQPPTAVFTQKLSYNLSIEVQKGECRDTFVFPAYINANPRTSIDMEKQEFCYGEQIYFKDGSELGADSVLWRFGDGSTSLDRNPSHIYAKDGCYTVSLFRFRGNCRDTVVLNCVKVLPAPIPDYSILNQFTCVVPVSIKLEGKSTGTYGWTVSSSSINTQFTTNSASFTALKFDDYALKINYTDSIGCKSVIDDTVKIKKFEANLPSATIGGCVPYDVIMSDSIISDIPITRWEWTVGNPVIFTSTQQSPKFRLNNVGLYDVRLIVTNTFGCSDTIFKQGYVGGGTPPTVDFTATPLEDCLKAERLFTQLAGNNANYWIWNFGDESMGEGPEIKHIYNSPDVYDVSLTAMHNGCASSITKPQYIRVLEPVSNYAIEYDCNNPFTVTLNNLTLGADSLYWEIYNGTSRDTIRDSILTSYTFPGRGEYTIQIYSKNFTTGCEHIRLDTVYITDPVALFTLDTAVGCVPLEINFIDQSIDLAVGKYYFGAGDTLTADSFIYLTGGKQRPPFYEITDIHGCKDTFNLDTFILANDIEVSMALPSVACVPQLIDISDLSKDSFAIINRWRWVLADSTYLDSNQIKANIVNPGTYEVFLEVSDSWGCVDSLVIKNAFEAVLLAPDFNSDSLGCTFSEMIFYPKGDNINTSDYLWTFGDGVTSNTSVAKHQYQTEGIYDVCLTLKDIRGCENTVCKSQWVDVKDPIALFTGSPTEEICPPLLTNFINESTNASSFQWDFGDNTGFSYVENPSHIYTEPDSFDVTLIAIRSESCTDTLSFKDYIKVLGPRGTFNYTLTGNCLPLVAEFSATSDDYYTYQWDFGNGDIDSSLTLSIADTKRYEYTKPGVYSAKLIIKDNNGCARNFSQEDIVVNDIQLNAVPDKTLFCGLPASISVTNNSISSSAITRYDWVLFSGVDSTVFSGSKNLTTSINAFGEYKVKLTATTENCILDSILSYDLNVQPIPVADFTFDKPEYCELDTILFTNTSSVASGSINQHIWTINGLTFEDFNPIYIFNNEGTETIRLKVISEFQCEAMVEKSLLVRPTTTASLIPDTVICLEEQIAFTPKIVDQSISYKVEWEEDGSSVCDDCSSYIAAPKDTIELVYHVVNQYGCRFSDTIQLNLAPVFPPEIDLGQDTILCNNTTAALAVKNYNSNYDYQWYSDLNFTCDPNCQSISTLVKNPGYFYATATNEFHCVTLDSIYAGIEKEIPDFLIGEKFICENAQTTLSVTEQQVLRWYDKMATLCLNCDSVLVSPKDSKWYFTEVQSEYGCHYVDSIKVNLVPLNSINAGNDLQICLGESKSLEGKGEGNTTWSFQNQIIGQGKQIIYKPQQTGYYTFTSVKDECRLQDSLYIEVLIKSTIDAIGDTVCYGDTAYVSASGLATQYNWMYKNASFQSNEQAFGFVPKETMNMLVIGSRTTCIPDSQEVLVFVHPKIEYELKDDDYTIYFNSKAKVEASYDASYPYQYEWTPVFSLSCADCPQPFIMDLDQSTRYVVAVTDPESACTIERSLVVRLNEECSKEGYYVPNIFIPGNQGTKSFHMKAVYPEDFRSITIFDRWGNRIYESDDINFSWDGTFNGRAIETGVYIYFVKAYCPELNEEFVFSGDVTIIR